MRIDSNSGLGGYDDFIRFASSCAHTVGIGLIGRASAVRTVTLLRILMRFWMRAWRCGNGERTGNSGIELVPLGLTCRGLFTPSWRDSRAAAWVEYLLQGGEQCGVGRWRHAVRRQLTEHSANRCRSVENRVHRIGLERELAVAKLVEQVLGEVAQTDKLGDIEKTGAALDGVKAAEDVVEELAVVWALLQLHELVVDIGKQLRGFGQEVLEQLFHDLECTHGCPRLARAA